MNIIVSGLGYLEEEDGLSTLPVRQLTSCEHKKLLQKQHKILYLFITILFSKFRGHRPQHNQRDFPFGCCGALMRTFLHREGGHHLPELIYGLFCGNAKYFLPRKNPTGST